MNGAIGLIEAGLETVAEALERWRRSHAWFQKAPYGLSVERITGGLSRGLERLQPPNTRRDKELLWSCADGRWTAYFDDRTRSDAVTALRGLSGVGGFRAFLLEREPFAWADGRDIRFILYENHDTLRSVQLGWEGRWYFDIHGEPLAFEEVERYQRRLKRERLTPDMLERYFAKIGLYPYDPEFFGREGILLSDIRTEFLRTNFTF